VLRRGSINIDGPPGHELAHFCARQPHTGPALPHASMKLRCSTLSTSQRNGDSSPIHFIHLTTSGCGLSFAISEVDIGVLKVGQGYSQGLQGKTRAARCCSADIWLSLLYLNTGPVKPYCTIIASLRIGGATEPHL
jgi:hypothetical protein